MNELDGLIEECTERGQLNKAWFIPKLEKLIDAEVAKAEKGWLIDLQMSMSINKTPEQNESDVLKLINRWDDALANTESNKEGVTDAKV